MTNYIKEEIICEAYTKLGIDIFKDKAKLDLLEKELMEYFEKRARFYLGKDVNVKIEFEEGSLITKMTVYGGAVTLATAISGYGNFRDNVARIADDAMMLAASANSEVIFQTKAAYCDRLDAERRKGIFGRVDEYIRKLDSINEFVKNSKLPYTTARIAAFNGEVENLLKLENAMSKFFGKLNDEASIACLASGLLEELERLPEEAPWTSELKGKSFRLQVAQNDPTLASNIHAGAARYKEAIAATKREMKRRVTKYAPQKT